MTVSDFVSHHADWTAPAVGALATVYLEWGSHRSAMESHFGELTSILREVRDNVAEIDTMIAGPRPPDAGEHYWSE